MATQAQTTPKPPPRIWSGLLSGLMRMVRDSALVAITSTIRAATKTTSIEPNLASSALCTSFTISGSIRCA